MEVWIREGALNDIQDFMQLQERAQMDGRFCDTAVVVKMDNSRDLDTDCIIKNVEGWYKEIAQKSKEEVDVLYQTRVSSK